MPVPLAVPVPVARAAVVPLLAPPAPGLPSPLLVRLPGGQQASLRIIDIGLACCAVEAMIAAVGSAQGSEPGDSEPAAPDAGTPLPVEVLVVSGTVTDRLAPLVQHLYASLPPPVRVISYGACANTGGPYWDSYCVTAGVDTLIPVDVHVPGCPPPPEALLSALASLL